MKKTLLSLAVLMALVAFGVVAAEAASSDSISVTVTITSTALDVSVTPGAWAVGSISEGATPSTTPDYFTATNNRNSAEDITLSIASSANWTAANTAGADQFGMKYNTAGATPSWTSIDSVSGALLADDLAAGASETFDLQLLAPTSTSAGGVQQTITVTVTAS